MDIPYINKFRVLKKQHSELNARYKEQKIIIEDMSRKLENVAYVKTELIKAHNILFNLGYVKNDLNEWVQQELTKGEK